MNTIESINNIVSQQREYFLTNETKSIDFRLKQLKKLKSAVEKYSDDIYDALWKDLHKCREEAFLTEINIVLTEINLSPHTNVLQATDLNCHKFHIMLQMVTKFISCVFFITITTPKISTEGPILVTVPIQNSPRYSLKSF